MAAVLAARSKGEVPRMFLRRRSCFAVMPLAALVAIGAASRRANAQAVPDCSTLNLAHPIYGAGGSAVTADLKQVGIKLSGLSSPVTVLYADAGGACTRFADFVNGSTTSTFRYWTSDGMEHQCNPPLTGQALDFSHMGNPSNACPNLTKPADVGEFTGPIQTINLITAGASSQQSISQEAAYFVFGFGDQGQAAPWTNLAHIALRSPTSAATILTADAIGVPPNKFKGANPVYSTQADVIAAIVGWAATSTEDPIGYVSGSAADAAQTAGQIKTLAFQSKGQTCAYWPDSTQTAKDKKNVRNGLYNIWSPGHFFAKIKSGSQAAVANIVNADVKNLIGWYRDEIDPPSGIDVVALTIKAGDVPQCAMHVTREGIIGAVSSWASPAPCDCFFEKTATGQTSCAACDASDPKACDGKPSVCRHGYCEAR
jgi:hypothetical protein